MDASKAGLWSQPPVPVLGAAPHASVLKALSILGMGRDCVELAPCRPGRLVVDPEALDGRLGEIASSEGPGPAIVNAGAGEVNTGDFDDLRAVGEICRRHGAWLHVDGAFGLFAACDPERAHLLEGIEKADSGSEHFDLLAPVRLNIVCFALRRRKGEEPGENAETATSRRDELLERLTADGRVLLSPTVFAGRPGIRAAFSNWMTGETDVGLVMGALEEMAASGIR